MSEFVDEDVQNKLDGFEADLQMVEDEIAEISNRIQLHDLERSHEVSAMARKQEIRAKLQSKIEALKREHPGL